MFELTAFFQHVKLASLLTKALVARGTPAVSLAVALVCDTLPASQLQRDCISKLVECMQSLTPEEVQQMKRLSPDFLTDLFLAS